MASTRSATQKLKSRAVLARLVRRAEFVGVGSSDGTIRIELGSEGFDPALLDPARWTQGATDRHQ